LNGYYLLSIYNNLIYNLIKQRINKYG